VMVSSFSSCDRRVFDFRPFFDIRHRELTTHGSFSSDERCSSLHTKQSAHSLPHPSSWSSQPEMVATLKQALTFRRHPIVGSNSRRNHTERKKKGKVNRGAWRGDVTPIQPQAGIGRIWSTPYVRADVEMIDRRAPRHCDVAARLQVGVLSRIMHDQPRAHGASSRQQPHIRAEC
jgi:hypothetical protein